jgi:hypothetical protein
LVWWLLARPPLVAARTAPAQLLRSSNLVKRF